ncbi:MAG: hypothetical protein R3C45_06825 [Phycisphaerales bacterium]
MRVPGVCFVVNLVRERPLVNIKLREPRIPPGWRVRPSGILRVSAIGKASRYAPLTPADKISPPKQCRPPETVSDTVLLFAESATASATFAAFFTPAGTA